MRKYWNIRGTQKAEGLRLLTILRGLCASFASLREPAFVKSGIVLLFFVSGAFRGMCQDNVPMRQQLAFTCDNNFFLLNGDDGYYTNGMFLRYDRVSTKQASASSKTILSYEIGQQIYNAHRRKILPTGNAQSNIPGGVEQIDRPIAGYLFGKVTRSSFYRHNMLSLGISVGSIGKNSFGRNVQEFWHNEIGVKDYWNWVWDYQVASEVGMNLHGTFAHSLLNGQQHTFIQVTPITVATLGTTFTDLSQSLLFQFGRLRPMISSTFWHSRLQSANDTPGSGAVEMFLFYKPGIKYQLYNATIQGGLFRDNKGPIVSDVKPFVLAHEVGVRFSVPRFSVGYHIVFQSREARGQFHWQSFGSVVGAVCF